MQREALIVLTVLLTLAGFAAGDGAGTTAVAGTTVTAPPADLPAVTDRAALNVLRDAVLDVVTTANGEVNVDICDWQIRFAGNRDAQHGSLSLQFDVAM